MRGLIWRWVINGLALFFAAQIVPNMAVDGFGSAMIAALVLGLANATIRPIIKFLTFPITILTLGLFTLIINGFILWIVSVNVQNFHVEGFFSAVLGAIILSVISSLLTYFVGDNSL
ncbi:phage holin family protein [Proteinivorax hydrogeniformans]|uniref:Phage holin family protein n=1 Tax=Proteinivorax hydrogeniformans TaxID=1826727 RepID=A0AAU8HV15_9FIRM